ncbi:hypothetical protein K502DRAFT_331207 [Neoconidiobolus thromboides FSU 785]|nr:hypothetical protein K502DRAFT_331207 [Neoconidiobolus thromboides FSU 785]
MSIPPLTTIATTITLQTPQNKLDKKIPHLSWSTKNILINSGIDPLLFSTTKLVDTVTNDGMEFHPKLNILNFEAINYTEEGDNSMELTSRWFLNNSQVLIYREEEGETEEKVGGESIEEVGMSGEMDFMCWDPTGRYVITYDQNHQLSVYLLEKGNGLLLLKSIKMNSKIQCYQFIKKRKEYSNFDVKSGDIIAQEFLGPKYEEGAFALVFLMQGWELGVMTCDSNDRMGIKLIDLKQYLPQLEGVEMNLTKMVFLKDEFVCIIVKDKVNKFYFISFEMDLNLFMKENQLQNINLLVLDLSCLILNENEMTMDQDKCDLVVNWYLDQIEVNYIVNYKNSSSSFISHCFNFKFTQMELMSLEVILLYIVHYIS